MPFTERAKPEPKATPPPKSSATVPTASTRAAAGEPFDEYRPSLWDKLERIVGYRVTDANYEQALAQARTLAAREDYDEVHGRQAPGSSPQVLVRSVALARCSECGDALLTRGCVRAGRTSTPLNDLLRPRDVSGDAAQVSDNGEKFVQVIVGSLFRPVNPGVSKNTVPSSMKVPSPRSGHGH